MKAQARQLSTPNPVLGACRIALACAAAALLAACGELSATTAMSDAPAATHDATDSPKADRAYNGTWNHNVGDVRVMSGTGRQVLR